MDVNAHGSIDTDRQTFSHSHKHTCTQRHSHYTQAKKQTHGNTQMGTHTYNAGTHLATQSYKGTDTTQDSQQTQACTHTHMLH